MTPMLALGAAAAERRESPGLVSRQPGLHPSILLVRTDDDSEVIRRLHAELGGSGWRIIEMSFNGRELETEHLGRLASEQGATAAVRVRAGIGQIDIYVGQAWGNVEETLRSDGEAASAQILALRTTEALRAHGLSIGQESNNVPESTPIKPNGGGQRPATGSAPVPSSIPNSPSADAAVRETAQVQKTSNDGAFRGAWLEMAPSFVISPGRLGSNWSGTFGFRLGLTPRWSWATFATIPFSAKRISDPEGQADIATYLWGTSVEAIWLRQSVTSAAVGLGISAQFTHMNGTANLGFAGTSETVVTAAPIVYLKLRAAMTPSWTVFATALSGTSIPEVSVKFGDRAVASWGQPFFVVGLGLECHCFTW